MPILRVIRIRAFRDVVKLFSVGKPQDAVAVKVFLVYKIQSAVGMSKNLREAFKIVVVAELPFMNNGFVG